MLWLSLAAASLIPAVTEALATATDRLSRQLGSEMGSRAWLMGIMAVLPNATPVTVAVGGAALRPMDLRAGAAMLKADWASGTVRRGECSRDAGPWVRWSGRLGATGRAAEGAATEKLVGLGAGSELRLGDTRWRTRRLSFFGLGGGGAMAGGGAIAVGATNGQDSSENGNGEFRCKLLQLIRNVL
jgi:hypothetical protein